MMLKWMLRNKLITVVLFSIFLVILAVPSILLIPLFYVVLCIAARVYDT